MEVPEAHLRFQKGYLVQIDLNLAGLLSLNRISQRLAASGRLQRAIGLFLIAVAHSIPSWACYCVSVGPRPCELQTSPKAVFVGKVISIENPPPDNGTHGDESGLARYRFSVSEAFKGVDTAEIDIYSGRGGGDCSYHFMAGGTYLVYTYVNRDGSMQVSMCSNTRPIEQAAALLIQLRAARDGRPVASLFGHVRRQQLGGAVVPGYDGPVQNATVLLISLEGHLFTARTDEGGNYAFYNLPPGTYGFDTDLPKEMESSSSDEMIGVSSTLSPEEPKPFKVPGGARAVALTKLPAGACEEHDVQELPRGKIRVRVIGPDGEMIQPNFRVDLSLFVADQYAAEGGRHDSSEFNHLAPGEYIVVFNNGDIVGNESVHRTFYPDSRDLAHAARVSLRESQTADVAIHVRDRIELRPLIIKLGWQGVPPENMPLFVTVRSNTPEYHVVERVEPGVFVVDIRDDTQYTVQGESYCRPFVPVATERVIVDGADGSLRELNLTLPKSLCSGR